MERGSRTTFPRRFHVVRDYDKSWREPHGEALAYGLRGCLLTHGRGAMHCGEAENIFRTCRREVSVGEDGLGDGGAAALSCKVERRLAVLVLGVRLREARVVHERLSDFAMATVSCLMQSCPEVR